MATSCDLRSDGTGAAIGAIAFRVSEEGGVGGDRSRRPPEPGQCLPESVMKAATSSLPQEPVGIVIAVRPASDAPTVFSAYVYGPAPTDDAPPKAA